MTNTPNRPSRLEGRNDEDALVREHLPLVGKLVAQVLDRVPGHVRRDELHAAGLAGLAQAARNFDPAQGVPFDRYAASRVRGAVLDELRSSDWASRPVRARAREVAVATERLTGRLGRAPSDEELAEAIGTSPAVIRQLGDDLHRASVLNFDSLFVSGEAETILPPATEDPEAAVLQQERDTFLARAVEALPGRLRIVIRGCFFEDRAMAEIAEELGVTQSRISQLRTEALELLREGMNAQTDPEKVTPLRRPGGRVSRRRATYYANIESWRGEPALAASAH